MTDYEIKSHPDFFKDLDKLGVRELQRNKDLLISLIRGLEDIKAGRIRPWKSRKKFSKDCQ